VLQLMQDDERMKEIPVVVMSSNESKDTIADCLSKISILTGIRMGSGRLFG